MEFRGDGFDVWVFRRAYDAVEFLLLHASQEKADAWFGGEPFWQIPSDFVGGRTALAAVRQEVESLGLQAEGIWAGEYAYSIYNRRYDDIVHLAVFAAEVSGEQAPTLGRGHDAHRWVSGDEAATLVLHRGLIEGLRWVRHFVTDRPTPWTQLRLDVSAV